MGGGVSPRDGWVSAVSIVTSEIGTYLHKDSGFGTDDDTQRDAVCLRASCDLDREGLSLGLNVTCWRARAAVVAFRRTYGRSREEECVSERDGRVLLR